MHLITIRNHSINLMYRSPLSLRVWLTAAAAAGGAINTPVEGIKSFVVGKKK